MTVLFKPVIWFFAALALLFPIFHGDL